MAWRNFQIENVIMGTIADGSTKMYQYFTYTDTSGVVPSDLTYTISFTQSQLDNISYDTFIVGDSSAGLQVKNYSNRHCLYVVGSASGQSYNSVLYYGNGDNCSVYASVDDETQKGTIFAVGKWRNEVFAQNDAACFNSAVMYIILKKIEQIIYNWLSVPSISGKNGILSLVTLDSESINDGEPVSGAAVSVFDQAPSNDNNVKNLADTYGGGEESSAVDVTVKYKVILPPGGSFSALKIVAKKDSIPEDASDGDNIVDISPTKTKKTISDLDENSLYYFKIFGEDTNGNTSESDEKHINTSEEEGVPFDYTGSIQEFTVPETGMYSLETWGAQGQNAGNNRGGYGAYAYAEAFLTEGQKLYIGIGGQNGYNGGGNFSSGNIRNIAIPDFNQSIIIDYSLWTNDWDSGRVTVGSLPKKFTIGYDFLDLVMNATLGTESVLIFERNGVKIYGMRDNTNASYGGYYKYSVYVKDGDEIVAGSQYPTAYYSQAWYVASGFDKRDSMYNSNVWSRIQALYLGFGVDDEARLGYMVGCAKRHQGYYQGVYINDDSFTSKKISNNTAQYGTYCNSAKLYDALKKMEGE